MSSIFLALVEIPVKKRWSSFQGSRYVIIFFWYLIFRSFWQTSCGQNQRQEYACLPSLQEVEGTQIGRREVSG